MDQKERKESLDHRAHPEYAAQLDQPDQREMLDHLASLDHMGNLASKDQRGFQERTEKMEKKERRALLVNQAHLAKWDSQEPVESLVPKVQRASKAHRECQARKAIEA